MSEEASACSMPPGLQIITLFLIWCRLPRGGRAQRNSWATGTGASPLAYLFVSLHSYSVVNVIRRSSYRRKPFGVGRVAGGLGGGPAPSQPVQNAPADRARAVRRGGGALQCRSCCRRRRRRSNLCASFPQASLPQADIDAWVEGRPPPSAAMPSLAAAEMRTIKLFSLNDYLGLSSHPDVRAAAADAALKYGNGEAGGDGCVRRRGHA